MSHTVIILEIFAYFLLVLPLITILLYLAGAIQPKNRDLCWSCAHSSDCHILKKLQKKELIKKDFSIKAFIRRCKSFQQTTESTREKLLMPGAILCFLCTVTAIVSFFHFNWRFLGTMTPFILAFVFSTCAFLIGILILFMSIVCIKKSPSRRIRKKAIISLAATAVPMLISMAVMPYAGFILLISTGGGMGH